MIETKESPIGRIPANWPIKKLKELTTKIGSGATPRGGQAAYLPHRLNFALVRSQCVHDRYFDQASLSFISNEQAKALKGVQVREGDVFLNITGDGVTFSRCALVPKEALPAAVNQHVAIVRADPDQLHPSFLVSYLTHPLIKPYIEGFNAGGSRRAITKAHIESFEVPLPPIETQRWIGEFLQDFDDKIELNRRMNETLEEIARALFRDWFVDFGPTRRQIEGATDPAAIMGQAFPPEKATTLAPLFPAKLGDDGLPEGWASGSASDHIDFNPKEPLKKGTVSPYSDMASLPTSGTLISPPKLRDFKSGMRFRNGDALIARITPCLENGKAGFVDYLTDEAPVGWGSTEFFVLRSKPHVAPQFAYCLVRDPDFKKRAEQSMTGTSGRQRAQVDVLMSYELAFPDDTVHAEFAAITTPFFAKIKANGEENQTLADMRDLLLPRLMSGEIRLKDAEVMADE
ncbi:MAG: restriction endonuclease subunit S [Pseudoruegeria sp.]